MKFLYRKNIKQWLVVLASILLFLLLYSNYSISKYSSQCYYSTVAIPKKKVGLLLGTIKQLRNGRVNLYYQYRLQAAVSLYKAKKISYILVSGDNSTENYNEPEDFQADLIALGIPASNIYLDYAGFRTLDSVVRCSEVFGEQSFTIISQAFHNERALFIANAYGLNAIGFNAKAVNLRRGVKVVIREYFARFKAFLDVYILHTSPKFLGKKIPIG